jgi:type II secretory pathway pseudopilin PulG
MMKKKAQIWVETVIYTLIGLVLIGMVLAVAVPFIEEKKNQRIVEDTLISLNLFDNLIEEVRKLGPGNQRQFDFSISEGSLFINAGEGNNITFEIEDSSYAASEVGRTQAPMIDIPGSNLKMQTEPVGKKEFFITILREYDIESIDLKFDGGDGEGQFVKAATSYRFIIENQGRDTRDLDVVKPLRINIYEAS